MVCVRSRQRATLGTLEAEAHASTLPRAPAVLAPSFVSLSLRIFLVLNGVTFSSPWRRDLLRVMVFFFLLDDNFGSGFLVTDLAWEWVWNRFNHGGNLKNMPWEFS